jgi:L-aspartate oxidase
MADCEFVQFHPTAIDVGIDPAPLATEALRGHGAVLVNGRGERFMSGLDPAGELAPRDVVARAIFDEIRTGRGAFLDCTGAVGERFPREFPVVHEHCRQCGLDPVVEKIPVKPAAHYFMGGIATDSSGRTSIPGLWACGECASTGVHGANRLASNSLLEAVVFAARTADSVIAGERGSRFSAVTLTQRGATACDDPFDTSALATLRETMSRDFGVVRCREGMLSGLETLNRLHDVSLSRNRRFANMLATARLIAAAAIVRQESRGAHFRTDFPHESKEFSRRSFLTFHDAETIAKTSRSLVA